MSRDEHYLTSLYPMCRELGSKPGAWEVLNEKDGKKSASAIKPWESEEFDA